MGGGSGLPYDYEVEYIGSSSKQLFNTGINGGDNVEYEIEFMYLPQKVAYAQLFGSGYIHSDNDYSPKLYMDDKRLYGVVEWGTNGVQNSKILNNAFNINTKYKIEYKNGYFKIDNNIICQPGIHGFGSLNFCIFGYLAEPNLKACMRLYYCKIWKDGILTGDFIPCSLDNVGYMYDKISKQLFGNTGDDAFIMGPPIDNHYDYEVEYIECTGTQWINTGKSYYNNTIEATYSANNPGNNIAGVIVGSNASSAKLPHVSLYSNKYYAGCYDQEKNGGTANFGTKHTIVYNGSDNALTVDGSVCISGTFTQSQYIIYLAHRVANDVYSCIKYYGFRITDRTNGTLLMDLIPVVKNNIGYMYDNISGRFFGNDGTGNFVVGPRVT